MNGFCLKRWRFKLPFPEESERAHKSHVNRCVTVIQIDGNNELMNSDNGNHVHSIE